MTRSLLLALLLVSAPAFADDWRTADTYREGAFLALHVVGWLQTREGIKHPDRCAGGPCYEQNPILGKHPSIAELNRYEIVTGLLQIGIANALPHGWRESFQYLTIAVRVNDVRGNWIVGLHGTW